MVLFTSDNGPWLDKGKDGGVAHPLRGGKFSCLEGGVREPTIAWWPGRITAGSTCDAMMSEMDVLPTLVNLAGGTIPADKKIDGLDVWPLLSGKSRKSPHEALFYFAGNKLQGVRADEWKLLNGQLYNLATDIGEKTNVAEKNPEVVQRLQSFMDMMDKDLGINGTGPGVRPCGKVDKPGPLVMDDKEYN